MSYHGIKYSEIIFLAVFTIYLCDQVSAKKLLIGFPIEDKGLRWKVILARGLCCISLKELNVATAN